MELDLLQKLNDICLFVKDFEESVRFYTEKMGFKIIRKQPGYVEFNFNGTAVTLWDEKGVYNVIPKEELGCDGHHFMLAVLVPNLHDVDDISDELISRGVKCISKPTTYEFGSRAAYFKDNNENIWEIFAWEERMGPGLINDKEGGKYS